MEVKSALLKSIKEGIEVYLNSYPFIIGRSKNANLVIAHVNVSRNHCQIIRENSTWRILDCSSSGTYLNHELIGKGNSKVIKNKDVIRFGPEESCLMWSFFLTNSEKKIPQSSIFKIELQSQAISSAYAEEKNLINVINSTRKEEKYFTMKVESIAQEGIKKFFKLENLQKDGENLELSTNNYYSKKDINFKSNFIENDAENLDLENPFMANEEKNMMKMKFLDLERTKELLLQKLKENKNFSDCSNLKKKSAVKTIQSNRKLETIIMKEEKLELENKKISTTESLLKELELVKSTLSDLENKNSLLEKKLAAVNDGAFVDEHLKSNTLENFVELMETEFQCTICSELFVSAVTLGCTHTFCKYCIDQWKKKQKTCPICRKKISKETKSLVVDNYIEKMVEHLSVEIKNHREKVIGERKETVPTKKFKRMKC